MSPGDTSAEPAARATGAPAKAATIAAARPNARAAAAAMPRIPAGGLIRKAVVADAAAAPMASSRFNCKRTCDDLLIEPPPHIERHVPDCSATARRDAPCQCAGVRICED